VLVGRSGDRHTGLMGTVEWIGLDGCHRVDAGIGVYPADQHAAGERGASCADGGASEEVTAIDSHGKNRLHGWTDGSPGGWVPPSRARAPLAAGWDFEEIRFRRQRLEHRADRDVDRFRSGTWSAGCHTHTGGLGWPATQSEEPTVPW
jgi:hypothetical protein